MKYDFTYNDITIPYEIIRKNVKNINIRIKPNCEVIVSCNKDVDNKSIELLIIKRAKWIINTINEYKHKNIVFSNVNYKLVDGEEFLLLGKVLRIKNCVAEQFKVNFDNNYLYIYQNNNKIINKFDKWHKEYIEKKIITLNKELIKVDEFLIEFVLTHEMIHFLYKKHDKNFWNFITMLMPDWKEREDILYSIFIK